MKSNRKTILTVVSLVIVIGGGLYFFFSSNSSAAPALTSSDTVASGAELSFISLVSKLDPIVFDTAILSDPRFTSRKDIRTIIVTEPSGRKDPFAPMGK